MLPTTRWRSHPASGARSGPTDVLPFPESRVLLGASLNTMLAGTQSALEAAIVALLPQLEPPVTTWSEGLPLCLPDEPDGTLVLKEVGRLDREDQLRLALWLDLAAGRMQVISTTSESMITLVERRAFLDLLYYRLNVIRLEIGAGR